MISLSTLAPALLIEPRPLLIKTIKPISKTKYLLAVLTALVGLSLQQAQAHLLSAQQFTLASPLGSPTSENTYLINNGYLPATSQYLGKFDKDNNIEDGAINID